MSLEVSKLHPQGNINLISLSCKKQKPILSSREANTPERSFIMEIIISFSISIRISGPKPEYLELSLNTVLTQP